MYQVRLFDEEYGSATADACWEDLEPALGHAIFSVGDGWQATVIRDGDVIYVLRPVHAPHPMVVIEEYEVMGMYHVRYVNQRSAKTGAPLQEAQDPRKAYDLLDTVEAQEFADPETAEAGFFIVTDERGVQIGPDGSPIEEESGHCHG